MTTDHFFFILEKKTKLNVVGGDCFQSGNRERTLGNHRWHRVGTNDGFAQARWWRERGVVVDVIIRLLVARTMAKLVSKQVERATVLFQYALSTKARCECITHILHTFTDLDDDATIVSIDGVGAYDLFSTNTILRGFLRMENRDQILPFLVLLRKDLDFFVEG